LEQVIVRRREVAAESGAEYRLLITHGCEGTPSFHLDGEPARGVNRDSGTASASGGGDWSGDLVI